MCEGKPAWRVYAKNLRESLSSKEKDEAIARHVLSSRFMQAESFFVYLSFGSEVGTKELIFELLARGKRVCVPRISGKKMLAVPYSDKLVEGVHHILQPETGEDTFCEVTLCPLLLADERGVRLGYGGGYYDRYFFSHPKTVRVGLMYAGQAVELLPKAPHDVPLQYAFTEEGERKF